MTVLFYRLVAHRYDGTAWKTLREHRDVATEAEAHTEGHRWLQELRDEDPDGLYEININTMREVKRKVRVAKPKTFVAYHEAGHAVAAWHFKYPITEASIVPGGTFGGVVTYDSPITAMNLDFDDAPEVEEAIRNDIVLSYAGRAAQQLFCPPSWKNYQGYNDVQFATEIASYLTVPELQETLHIELLEEARELVVKYRMAVEAVAIALLGHKELSGDEVERLIEDATDVFHLMPSKLFAYRDPAQQNPFDSVEDVF